MTKVLSFLDTLPIISAALMGVALWLIFIWVPTEINQGAVQRILYFHVPVAWGSMLGIIIVSGSSIMYLWKKNEKWDRTLVDFRGYPDKYEPQGCSPLSASAPSARFLPPCR